MESLLGNGLILVSCVSPHNMCYINIDFVVVETCSFSQHAFWNNRCSGIIISIAMDYRRGIFMQRFSLCGRLGLYLSREMQERKRFTWNWEPFSGANYKTLFATWMVTVGSLLCILSVTFHCTFSEIFIYLADMKEWLMVWRLWKGFLKGSSAICRLMLNQTVSIVQNVC